MSHLHSILLRQTRAWSWVRRSWPTPLLLTGQGVEDESAPPPPNGTEQNSIIANKAMATSPSSFVRNVVEDEPSPLHPTEKEKSMVMGHKVMANFPFSLLGSWGGG